MQAKEIKTVDEFIREIYSRHEEYTRNRVHRSMRIGQVAMNLAAEFHNNYNSAFYDNLVKEKADIYYIKDVELPDSPVFERFLEISRRFFQNQKVETSSVDEPAVEELPEPLPENQIGSPTISVTITPPVELPQFQTDTAWDRLIRNSPPQIWEMPSYPSAVNAQPLLNAINNIDAVDAAALTQAAMPQTPLMSFEEFQQLNDEWGARPNSIIDSVNVVNINEAEEPEIPF